MSRAAAAQTRSGTINIVMPNIMNSLTSIFTSICSASLAADRSRLGIKFVVLLVNYRQTEIAINLQGHRKWKNSKKLLIELCITEVALNASLII